MTPSVSISTSRERRLTAALLLLWGLLLLLALGSPALLSSADPGDDRVRFTIRLALLFYGAAAASMLAVDRPDRLARWLWSLALGAYLIHVALAFHYYHHWSHADAYARTAMLTNFGPGIYISHLFGLVWTLDAVWWWLAPASRARRRPWLGWLLHGFLWSFIIFNGAVIFATGVVRWAALAMFLGLAGLWLRRALRRQQGKPGFLQAGPIAGIPRET